MKIYIETDNIGEHKVIEQKNGIKIRILKKPSPEYAEKLKARAEKEKIRMTEEKEKQDQEKIIQNKMREIAIREIQN
jgi:hypothetical protein